MADAGILEQKRQLRPLSPENTLLSQPWNGSMDIVEKKRSCSSLVGMVFGIKGEKSWKLNTRATIAMLFSALKPRAAITRRAVH
jgi:hypothetical protein